MRQTNTLVPWRGISFAERWALDAATAVLWPLQSDQRMTVLINLLAEQIEEEDEVDAISDMLKLSLKDAGKGHGPHRH
jgi:hypothetical protein